MEPKGQAKANATHNHAEIHHCKIAEASTEAREAPRTQLAQATTFSRSVSHVERPALEPLLRHRHRYRPRRARDLSEGGDRRRSRGAVPHVAHPEVLPVCRHRVDYL